MGNLKPATEEHPEGMGLVRRIIAHIAGKQGPGTVVNDELTIEPCGQLYRRVERSWFNGTLTVKAVASLLYIRALGRAHPWQIAKRFGWSLPTVKSCADELVAARLLANAGTYQRPVYVPGHSKIQQSKKQQPKKGRYKKEQPLHSDIPLHTVSPLPSVDPALSAARKPASENAGRTDGEAGTVCLDQHPPSFAVSGAGFAKGAGGKRVPFTAAVVAELERMGCDVPALVARYFERTKDKHITDPSAYLLKMGRDELAKQYGLRPEQLKAASSRNAAVRAAAFVDITRPFNSPSIACLARARRNRPRHVDEVLKSMSGRNFISQRAADHAFEQEMANVALRQGHSGSSDTRPETAVA